MNVSTVFLLYYAYLPRVTDKLYHRIPAGSCEHLVLDIGGICVVKLFIRGHISRKSAACSKSLVLVCTFPIDFNMYVFVF